MIRYCNNSSPGGMRIRGRFVLEKQQHLLVSEEEDVELYLQYQNGLALSCSKYSVDLSDIYL